MTTQAVRHDRTAERLAAVDEPGGPLDAVLLRRLDLPGDWLDDGQRAPHPLSAGGVSGGCLEPIHRPKRASLSGSTRRPMLSLRRRPDGADDGSPSSAAAARSKSSSSDLTPDHLEFLRQLKSASEARCGSPPRLRDRHRGGSPISVLGCG